MKSKILLFGPKLSAADRAYGGGTGGFTRNMSAYLNYFKSDAFAIEPSFHSIRGGSKLDFFVLRFFKDAFSFIKDIINQKPKGIHILAQYRTAIPREFIVVLISKILSVPVLYEVKAGSFITWFESTNIIFKSMMKFVLGNSDVVLAEGIPYLNYLKEYFNIDAHYFPNYVPSAEVPEKIPEKLLNDVIKVLFVGYAYKAKGVYELVEGCNLAAKNVPIELTLIGKESEEFKTWLDNQSLEANFIINRLGVKPHHIVLEWFDKIDVYCYPTSHKGEGHNNSINEAMMMGAIIITTKQGFLGTVLSNERAYFLDKISPEEISSTFEKINNNRPLSKTKALESRNYLVNNFTSEVAYKKLVNHYKVLTG